MSGEAKGQELVIDKVRSTLLELMDNEDPTVRLDAVRLALGNALLTGRKDNELETAALSQPGGGRGRRGGEE